MDLKYFYTFKSNKNNYKVEIYENSYDGYTPKEISKVTEGFILKNVSVEDKLTPIQTSAANFTILSPSTFTYIDLLTSNMQMYLIVFYKNNNKIWSGWLNTECYEEDFSLAENIDVDFTASDFNILERLKWLKSDGSMYDTNMTHLDVIKTIFSKLQIPFDKYYIGSSTSSFDYVMPDNTTVLDNEYSNWCNWYDEDNIAMTCKDVLSGILTSYSLTIKQVNNCIYIYDLNTMLNTNNSFLEYDNNFKFVKKTNINFNNGDISNIGVSSSSSTYSNIPSYNRVKIKYNRYRVDKITENNIKKEDLFNTQKTEQWSDYSEKNEDFGYSRTYYYNCKRFKNLQGLGDTCSYVSMVGNREYSMYKDPIYGIYYFDSSKTNGTEIIPTNPLPYIISDDKYKLKIHLNLYLETHYCYFSQKVSIDKDILAQAYLRFAIYIDSNKPNALNPECNDIMLYTNEDFFFGNGTQKWVPTTINRTTGIITDANKYKSYIHYYNDDKSGNIANINLTPKPLRWRVGDYKENPPEFNEEDFTIPMPNFSGNLKFLILPGLKLYNNKTTIYTRSVVPYMINNLRLNLTNINLSDIDDKDIEYNSYINKTFKDDADDIDFYLGTNTNSYPLEKGAIMYKKNNDFKFITKHIRSGSIELLEKLHMRTFIANYNTFTSNLSIDVNNSITPIGYVSYNKYLPNIKLCIYNYEINYTEETANVDCMEINNDNTINIKNIQYESD